MGTPQTTASPAHEPGRPRHDCPPMTLPVVIAQPKGDAAAQGQDRTPAVPAAGPAPRCVPRHRRPRVRRVHGGEARSRHGRFQPVPPPPFPDSRPRTLTMARCLG